MAVLTKDKAVTLNILKSVYDSLKRRDNTLTEEGVAADAKATGDAINAVKESVSALDNKVFNWGMLKNGFGWIE